MLKLTAGLLLGNEMTHTHRVAAVTVLTVLSFWLLGTASIVFWIIGLWFSTNLMRMPWLQLENIHSWLCVFTWCCVHTKDPVQRFAEGHGQMTVCHLENFSHVVHALYQMKVMIMLLL